MKRIVLLISIFFLLITEEIQCQDAQWRGPDRSGIFPEAGLLQEWPEQGPEMVLKVDSLGKGISSPVLSEGIIYITGKKGEHDYLSAVDLDGEVKYQVNYGRSWEKSYPDSRTTPTIDGDRVYVISGMGEIVCLSKEEGKIIWKVDAHTTYKGEFHSWGVAESPLIVDEMVLYTSGGENTSLIAFNKHTGDEVWKTESVGGARTYVSPVLYENGTIRQIIAATSHYFFAVFPESGEVAWTYKHVGEGEAFNRRATITTNSAIISGNEVFFSRGYDQYGVMLRVGEDGKSVTEKWRTDVLDTHHGHYVKIGDYIYGSTWINNSKGNWACIRWDTGEQMYEETWKTKGPIAFADGKLYCWEERTGNFALVKPTPEKFDIVSTFKVEYGSGPHWAHPYIADGKLLLRHGAVLMVFNIKA